MFLERTHMHVYGPVPVVSIQSVHVYLISTPYVIHKGDTKPLSVSFANINRLSILIFFLLVHSAANLK